MQKFSMRKFGVLCLSALVFCLVSPISPVFAADTSTTNTPAQPTTASSGSTLSVAPALLEYTAEPGASFTAQVTVVNGTVTPVAIQSTAQGYVPEGKLDPAYKAAYDASPWFNLDTDSFLLLSQQSRTVNVHIAIPKDAEPGGHYATIYFESFTPDQADASNATSVNGRLGVVVLLTVKGTISQSVVASGPVRTGSTQFAASPTTFHISLENKGNVHVMPTGSLVITDMFGRKVKTLPLPSGILLPGVERDYDVTWNHGLLAGQYKAEAKVSYDKTQQPLIVRPTHIVLFPVVVVVPAVLLLLIVVFFGTMPRRRRRRRMRAKTKALLQLAGKNQKEEAVVDEPAATEPAATEPEVSEPEPAADPVVPKPEPDSGSDSEDAVATPENIEPEDPAPEG